MLKFLNIKNIAIINECKIEFGDNFNCLTGETGAGKSIIIDSLNFVLGSKIERNLISTNCDFAQVDVLFDISEYCESIKDEIYSLISDECDDIQISRYLSSNGKSVFKINGDNVSSTIVKKLSTLLVDIFGQSDHQLLLNNKFHLFILDSFITEKDDKLVNLKSELNSKLDLLKEANNEIKKLGGIGSDKEKRIELLNYEIDEIRSANLIIDEDINLQERKKLLLNSERIYNSLNDSISELKKVDIVNILKSSSNCLKQVENFSEQYSILKDKLIDIKFDLEDTIEQINDLKNDISYSENEIEEIENRIQQINDLKRKYGHSIEDILKLADQKEVELDLLFNSEAELNKVLKRKDEILSSISNICGKISNLRKDYAKLFEKELLENIIDLGMKNSKFVIDFNAAPEIDKLESSVNQTGYDNVEFLFSANLGQDLKPLNKVLSGGEMSRFMLAFKGVVSSVDNNKTYIFDEIDTGIGGSIGSVVGKKIAKISKNNQVICITHLAQIACFADNNFKIYKSDIDNKTVANVNLLSSDEVVSEVTRMIGTLDNFEFAKLHASELIKEAKVYKQNL